MKQQCWQYKKCGRQQGGSKATELGVCPASVEQQGKGINAGQNAGRICWAIAGTLCGGKVQGAFAAKQASCLACDFYKLVRGEEGAAFRLTLQGQSHVRTS